MSFQEYNDVERMLEEKGHTFKRCYRAFESGELRIISERDGRDFRWIPIYDEYRQIVGIKEKP